MQEGTLLGNRFRLGPRMARGRRGELFAATDGEDGKICQVEVIAASGQRVEDLGAELAREVLLGERLPDSCLRACGWGRTAPDILFVARRWLPGLRPFNVTRGPLAGRLSHLRRLAERVHELHQAGVIHRDLSILTALQTDQDVFLAGLRFAKAEGVEEPPPDARGFELSYLPCASPEVLADPESADARADVFSLGVLLQMALTGQAPYPGPTLAHLVRQHEGVRNGYLPFLGPQGSVAGLPDPINELCRRSTLPSADERIPDVATWVELFVVASSELMQEAPAAKPEGPSAKPAAARAAPAADPDPAPLSDPFASDQGQVPADERWGAEVRAAEPAEDGEYEEESEVLSPAEALAFLEAQSATVKAPSQAPASQGPALEEPPSEDTDVLAALPEGLLTSSESERLPAGRASAPTARLPRDPTLEGKPEIVLEPPPDEGTDEFAPLPEVANVDSSSGAIEPDPEEPDPEEPDLEDEEDSDEGPASWVASAMSDEEDSSEEDGPFRRPATASWIRLAEEEAEAEDSEESGEGPVGVAPEAGAEAAPGAEGAEQDEEALDPADARVALDAAVAAAAEGLIFESGDDLGELDLTGDVSEGDDELILEEPVAEEGAEGFEGQEEVVQAAPAPPPPPPAALAPPPPPPPSLPELAPLPEPEPELEPEPEPDPDPLPPEAFSFVEPVPPALILRMPKGPFGEQVHCAKAVVAEGFDHLLLDLSALNHLNGEQMGALTAIRSACEAKDLDVAMFGLTKQVRFVASMMADMELPPALEAVDTEAALAEVGEA